MSSPSAAPTDVSARDFDRDEPSIEETESSPPPEVLDQMARADEINSRLRERGLELVFALSADGGSLQIELRDSSGHLLRVLTAAEAADLASGGDL